MENPIWFIVMRHRVLCFTLRHTLPRSIYSSQPALSQKAAPWKKVRSWMELPTVMSIQPRTKLNNTFNATYSHATLFIVPNHHWHISPSLKGSHLVTCCGCKSHSRNQKVVISKRMADTRELAERSMTVKQKINEYSSLKHL